MEYELAVRTSSRDATYSLGDAVSGGYQTQQGARPVSRTVCSHSAVLLRPT